MLTTKSTLVPIDDNNQSHDYDIKCYSSKQSSLVNGRDQCYNVNNTIAQNRNSSTINILGTET